MTIDEVRQSFINYYKSIGYRAFRSSSLIPQNDPSVLFTTAGMQQFRDYYLDPSKAPFPKLVTVQPVIRTSDIESVGDDTHLTHFEMLGNFSFGLLDERQMKKEAIKEAWTFLTEKLEVNPSRLSATVFRGEKGIASDNASLSIWKKMGVEVSQRGKDDNFWGPTGKEGPCGPTSEIYLDGIEVWNLVFNQYYQHLDGSLTSLKYFGLDTGSGLERLAATLEGELSVWQIEPFNLWVKEVSNNSAPKEKRKIIDHLKAIVFLISEDILPSNKGREYIVRRLIRSLIYYLRQDELLIEKLVPKIVDYYKSQNYHLREAHEINSVIKEEADYFRKNLSRALAVLDKTLKRQTKMNSKELSELAFQMYESYGLPREMINDYFKDKDLVIDERYIDELFRRHQETSRKGLDKQFTGGLADHSEQTVKHHTAHHLLLAALRRVLGPTVVQRGSNITTERLRLDFNFDRKLTGEEIQEVEEMVNKIIVQDLPVKQEIMSKEKALKSGALAEFGAKYGEEVSVYSVGDFSRELCGGPHVKRTGELGRFVILKEEASSQGVRRIKARLT